MASQRRACAPYVRLSLVVSLAAGSAPGGQQREIPGAFRSAVRLVALDLRVTDSDGRPVIDLRPDEVEVFEDDERQTVSHFASGGISTAGAARRSDDVEGGPGQAPRGRTFLVVLGRGRLQEPGFGLHGLTRFVANLPPQDRVAVMAHGRVTDFLVAREPVARIVERYAERHEALETRLDHWFSGLTLVFGSREIPQGIRSDIDAVFEAPGLPRLRAVPYAGLPGSGQFERDRQRMMASVDPANMSERDEDGKSVFIIGEDTRQDLMHRYAGIEFLRFEEGEKHLVFLSEEGQALGDGVERLAAMAASARVTISPIHTGGLPLDWASGQRGLELRSRSARQTWAFEDAKALAQKTGGVGSFHERAEAGFDEIDRTTRSWYEIGYYPINTNMDGSFRRIRVEVRRTGVTVRHRLGYYAQPTVIPTDPERFVPYARMTAAGAQRETLTDLTVGLAVPPGGMRGNSIHVDLTVTGAGVTFDARGSRHHATLNLAVFAGDSEENVLGEAWERVELSVDDRGRQRVERDGVRRSLVINLTGGQPRYLKAVVHDYLGDRLGTFVRPLVPRRR